MTIHLQHTAMSFIILLKGFHFMDHLTLKQYYAYFINNHIIKNTLSLNNIYEKIMSTALWLVHLIFNA